MKLYNLIVILDSARTRVLMCRRQKEPFAGMLNFVGGKIEDGELHDDAAYRELEEETSITRENVTLCHMIDLSYPLASMLCEVWTGVLLHPVDVYGSENELLWLNLTDDFTDVTRFAGYGNIYHILEYVKASL